MTLPLEDNFDDVINKAVRGLRLTDAQIAEAAALDTAAVQALRGGEWDERAARKVAPVLGLEPDALSALGNRSYQPEPIALDGLAQFNTSFDDMTVNAYLVWDPATGEAAAFDTGGDCSGMLALLGEKKLVLRFILLTHTHGDHVFDLDRLKEKTGAPALVGEREPLEGAEEFAAGRTFEVSGLKIETRLTWGHSKGGITYVISGLARPVAIVGDAIFAGSMGGGMISYEAALHTNREQIFTLPDETVICPGHGPMTTVGAERTHNPFFAS